MITLSEKAKAKILDLMKNENPTNKPYLRVGVKGGGCAGFSYQLEFDDTIRTDDEIFDFDQIKVICNKASILYIFGTELDYSDGLNGKGFEWKNPNATRSCGCGESFAV